jgi:hypothetical protein
VGPPTVRMKVPEEVTRKRLLLTVSAETIVPVRQHGGWVQFEVKSVLDHQVAVLE